MFSERKNVRKDPIRGSLHVQFPPAGDTVCNADRTPPKKKDYLMGGLSFLVETNGLEPSTSCV